MRHGATKLFRVALFSIALTLNASCEDWPPVVVVHESIPSPVMDDEEQNLRHRDIDIDMGSGLMPMLSKIRTDWPGTTEITARMDHQPGVLLLKLEPSLATAVSRSLPREGTSGLFHTGYREFDALNRSFGLQRVQSFVIFPSSFHIEFDPNIDIASVAQAYASLEGVSSASLNTNLVSGPDLHAHWGLGGWHVVFRNAWGDCPAGCLYAEYSYFRENRVEKSVVRMGPDLAREIPEFRSIHRERGLLWLSPLD